MGEIVKPRPGIVGDIHRERAFNKQIAHAECGPSSVQPWTYDNSGCADYDEELAEISYELTDFTRSGTWQRVIKPSLEKRQKEIQRKLAIGLNLELDKIREMQVIYKLIDEILDSPIKFFSFR